MLMLEMKIMIIIVMMVMKKVMINDDYGDVDNYNGVDYGDDYASMTVMITIMMVL